MRILITGASGRLGGRLLEILSDEHVVKGVDVISSERVEALDITDFPTTKSKIVEFNPDVVLHSAAWTDVDGCAKDPEKALVINGYGAQNVALAAAESNAAILHVSSNEVFDGKRNTPYMEYDSRMPVNPYGHSKMVGERAVAAVNQKHYIVRTAWLFAHGGRNFIQAILNAAELGKDLRVVTDEVANPTYNDDLATAIVQLIKTRRYGTYHMTNEGACSRYNFARYALDKAGYEHVPIIPISSREWSRASMPPTYAALSNIAGKSIGVTMRSWRDAVDAFLLKEGLIE